MESLFEIKYQSNSVSFAAKNFKVDFAKRFGFNPGKSLGSQLRGFGRVRAFNRSMGSLCASQSQHPKSGKRTHQNAEGGCANGLVGVRERGAQREDDRVDGAPTARCFRLRWTDAARLRRRRRRRALRSRSRGGGRRGGWRTRTLVEELLESAAEAFGSAHRRSRRRLRAIATYAAERSREQIQGGAANSRTRALQTLHRQNESAQ